MTAVLRLVTPRPAAPEALPVNDLPEPMTDLEIDLRAFPSMQLDVARLRDSELASVGDAEAFRVAVLSWCVSWHQIPAASLPDDDATLARMLGFGRDLRGWKKMRAAGGLRGWVKCSDGRLYHPVVAEKAKEAWGWKESARHKRERDAERLRRWREGRDGTPVETHSETRFNAERTERNGSERIGSDLYTPPPSPGISPRTPPAATAALSRRVDGVDNSRVREAIEQADLLGLVAAFGGNLDDDRAAEWKRDCDGLQLGTVFSVLAWKRTMGESIREPSGFRKANPQWHAIKPKERQAISRSELEAFGIDLPTA
jgi:hypothetical protein